MEKLKNDLKDTISAMSINHGIYSINLEYAGYDKDLDKFYKSKTGTDYCSMIQVVVTVKHVINGLSTKFKIDLLKMPIKTERGYKIGKSYKQILKIDKKAPGWFIFPAKKSEENANDKSEMYAKMEYKSNFKESFKFPLYFQCKNGQITVSRNKSGQNNSSRSSEGTNEIDLGTFLKAITRKSYTELISILGESSFVLNSFNTHDGADGPSVNNCIKVMQKSFLTQAMLNQCNNDPSKTYNEIMNRLFVEDFIGNDNPGYTRFIRNSSFTKRAKDSILLEDIETPRVSCKAGVTLDRQTLEELDADPSINKIRIEKDGKRHTLLKYPAKKSILTIDEILTAVNMYVNALDGLDCFDSQYDTSSRVVVDFETSVLNAVIVNCKELTDNILSVLLTDTNDNTNKLVDLIRYLQKPKVDELLDSIKNSNSTHVQQASHTNILKLASDSGKLTSDFSGKASSEAIKVQDTERTRTDTIEQPESSKIGKVHHETLLMKVDKDGFQTTPYLIVKNGCLEREDGYLTSPNGTVYDIQGNIIENPPYSTFKKKYLTASQEDNAYIACFSDDLSGEYIRCYYEGTVMDVPRNMVNYKDVSCFQSLSFSRAWIALLEFSNPRRLQMGSGQLKQAIVTLSVEKPVVSTGSFAVKPVGITTANDILTEYYDNHSHMLTDIPKETFIKQPLKLISSTIGREQRLLNFEVGRYKFTKAIPFLISTEVNTIYSDRLLPAPNNTYVGEDIVYHNINTDIRKTERIDCADYGEIEINETHKDYDLALGNNLLVAYKTFEGSTIDDSISIRKGLAYSSKLTSVYIFEKTVKLYSMSDVFEEEFACENSSSHAYLKPNGLPKEGAYIKPGYPLVSKKRIRKNAGNIVDADYHKINLDSNVGGEVISATIDGDEAIILLATIENAEVGDKLAGRHGNKGVIAKLVDDHDMPYIKETGEIIDVCLNPLGVPSRMNISQLFEAVLSLALREQNKTSIVTPYHPDAKKFIIEQTDLMNIQPMELVDGRTGELIKRLVNVGSLYMLKLEHMAKKKIKSCNITHRTNFITGQPQDGSGGQAVGEYETWVYAVENCPLFLQELMSVQSDDLQGLRNLKKLISGNPYDVDVEGGNNNNDVHFMAMLTTMSILLTNTESGDYDWKLLTDSEVLRLSQQELSTDNAASLHDITIFGDPSDNSKKEQNRKKYGYIDLHCEIVNPFILFKTGFVRSIPVIVDINSNGEYKYKLLTENMIKNIINPNLGEYLVKMSNGFYQYVSSMHVKSREGFDTLLDMLKTLTVDKCIACIENNQKRFDNDLEDTLKARMTLENFKESDYELKDLIISKYPVLPIIYRPEMKESNTKHDLETGYTNIFNKVLAIKNAEKNNSVKNPYDVFMEISKFIGVTQGLTNNKVASVATIFMGKNKDSKGMIRSEMLSKRVHFSGRSVIVPSQDPNMRIDEIRIPRLMAMEIWKLHLESIIEKNIHISNIVNSVPQVDNKLNSDLLKNIATKNFYKFRTRLQNITPSLTKEEVKVIYFELERELIKFIEQQVAVAGRQPSLHKYAAKAYHVKITDSKAIEIHPLVCKGYNADFDGDTMYVIAVLSNSAKEEVLKNLTPKRSIINPKDSSTIVEHVQDMCLGIYFATMLYDNVTDANSHPKYKQPNGYNIFTVPSVEALEILVESNCIELQDLVSVEFRGGKYLSTAGRLLFNSKTPDGFTSQPHTNTLNLQVDLTDYCDIKYDGLIAKKAGNVDGLKYLSLSEITTTLSSNYSIDQVMDMLQDTMVFGLKYSDISGISIGPRDFELNYDDIKDTKDTAKRLEQEINLAFLDGLLSEEGRHNSLITMGNSLEKTIEGKLKKLLQRNNNLFIIKDSGARGSDGQMAQTLGMAGMKMKTLNTSFEVPIYNSYADGLSPQEMNIDSYGARQGSASTQLGTADAGYGTRQMVMMVGGVAIKGNVDCGADPINLKIEYAEPHKIVICDKKTNQTKTIYGDSTVVSNELLNKQFISVNPQDVKFIEEIIFEGDHLTFDQISMIIKKAINYVEVENYTYHIYYKLSPLYSNILNNRLVVDFNYEHDYNPRLIDGYVPVTSEYIKYLEETNPEYVKVKMMLNCQVDNGICPHCYGLRFDTNTLPTHGYQVGIESAQSLGEPSAQLVMSLFHTGGVAGESVSSGVVLNKAILKGSLPTGDRKALHTTKGGNCSINYAGKMSLISIDGKVNLSCPTNLLTVSNGEYVYPYQRLSKGLAQFNYLGVDPSAIIMETPNTMYSVLTGKRGMALSTEFNGDFKMLNKYDTVEELPDFRVNQQLTLLTLYFDNFVENNITLNARHFEILVKVQTGCKKVLHTNVPEIKVGWLYEYHNLKELLCNSTEENPFVMYDINIAKQNDTVTLYNGSIASIVFERGMENISKIVTSRQILPEQGIITKIAIGSDIATNDKKAISKIQHNKSGSRSSSLEEVKNENASSIFEAFLSSDEEQVSEQPNFDAFGDFGDTLNLEDFVIDTVPEIAIDSETDETNKRTDTITSKLDLSN